MWEMGGGADPRDVWLVDADLCARTCAHTCVREQLVCMCERAGVRACERACMRLPVTVSTTELYSYGLYNYGLPVTVSTTAYIVTAYIVMACIVMARL